MNTAFCPCGVRSPGVCLASATQVLDHVPSSPAESSCISPSQLPSWTRPGTPLSRQPAAADAHTSPAGQDMCRILPTPGDPICTGIFHTSAKDSPTSPRTGRQDKSARSCHDPAICPLADPISREEGSDPRTPRAPGAPHYIPGHPGRDLPARLMTVIDPRDTPELPVIDPPETRAATRCRPAPTTTPGVRFCRDGVPGRRGVLPPGRLARGIPQG